MDDEWMLIGRIAAPFGIRGEIKVNLLTDFPERFDQLDELIVGPERRRYSMERSRHHRGQVLIKLEGLDNPEDVDHLRGLELFVPRADAVPLPEGHYYLDDLVGVRVYVTDGRVVGEVRDVLRTGSNDVYVVGDGQAEVLIPGIKDAVRELNLADRRLVVEPWVLDAAE